MTLITTNYEQWNDILPSMDLDYVALEADPEDDLVACIEVSSSGPEGDLLLTVYETNDLSAAKTLVSQLMKPTP